MIDKSSLENITEEEAKEWLVKKYLKAFGPSSTEDIISYTWYTKTESKKIIERLMAKGKVLKTKIDTVGKCWILSEDIKRLEELKAEKHPSEKFDIVQVLPEFDPLTVGYRKRWKRLISVPSTRPGLRPHPAPGVILSNGKIIGKYLTWPNVALFFNIKVEKLKAIKTILDRFEEMALLMGRKVFCIKKIDGKAVSSEELKPKLSYFYELGYLMREGCLCKKLV